MQEGIKFQHLKKWKKSLRSNVLKLLLKYNKIAFGGMDNYFLELVKDINEIMKNENINCIIVAVPKFYSVIKNDIEKECNMYNIL